MDWLAKLSRNLGLMVHNMKHPEANTSSPKISRQEVSKKVEEEQIDAVTTLRRTTIEEIEVKQRDTK